MSIITLTLNPAFDVHADCPGFSAGHEYLATHPVRTAGGKGLNITRALAALGVSSRAIILAGAENAGEFADAVKADGIDAEWLFRPGRIRENLTLHTHPGETRISFEGFTADDSVLSDVAAQIGNITPGTTVTFTGRLPVGVTGAAGLSFLKELRQKGAFLAVDSKSLSLDDLTALKPQLIKPNEEEAAAFLGRPIETVAQAAEAARFFHRSGIAFALLSLGDRGLVAACDEGVFYCSAPKVQVRSTIGAGDSTIAGFLAAKEQGLPTPEALRLGVAAGSAACTTEGTCPPTGAAVSALLPRIKAEKIT